MDQTKSSGSEHTGITLPKTFVTGLLGMVFALAFVITPYWLLVESDVLKGVILFVTIGVGAIWSHVFAGNLKFDLTSKHMFLFGLLLAATVTINYRALTYSIPWRGDESFHIQKILIIISNLSPLWHVAALTTMSIILYLAWTRPKLALLAGLIIIIAIILVYLTSNQPLETPEYYFYYPFVNFWFYSFVPNIAAWFTNQYIEVLYRIIPIACASSLAWLFTRKVGFKDGKVLLLWGLAIVTIPSVYYYSSILYLELPAVLLMLVVCLDINKLLHANFQDIHQNPSWYALILMGFIKETTIIFLLMFLVCRLFLFIIKKGNSDFQARKPWMQKTITPLKDEILIAVGIFLPILLYLSLRITLGNGVRTFTPDISSLFNLSTYVVIAYSLTDQFGLFLLIFIAGIASLFAERKPAVASFHILAIISLTLFHAIDSGGIYAGYSRFNLLALPPVLAGSMVAIQKLTKLRVTIGAISSVVLILVNLLMAPVNLDGSKEPRWGNYRFDTSEYYYPYRDAFLWMKQTYPDSNFLLVSAYYPYHYAFYFGQLEWKPKYVYTDFKKSQKDDEIMILTKKIEKAQKEGLDVVLYQVVNNTVEFPLHIGQYNLEKTFSNNAQNVLIVYTITK